MVETELGRRERKKAATRKGIADTALRLFLERGFDAVSVREIAEAADVSTTTLFNHFAVKEELVFDQDASREAGLVSAVREWRTSGSLLASLHCYFTSSEYLPNRELDAFYELIESTPALRAYSAVIWSRYETVLADSIAEATGKDPSDMAVRALARFVLDIPQLVRGRPHTRHALDQIFALLENGWKYTQIPPSENS